MMRCLPVYCCVLLLHLLAPVETHSLPGWLFRSEPAVLGPWEFAFSAEGEARPESLGWRAGTLPGPVGTTATDTGYAWLRAPLSRESGGQALLLGPAGHSLRVYVNGGQIGADGASGKDFSSRLGLYRCYALPAPEAATAGGEVIIRLYHRRASWVEGGVWLLPLEDAQLHTLILNLIFLFSRAAMVFLLLYFFLRFLFGYFLEKAVASLYLSLVAAAALLYGLCSTFLPLIVSLPASLRVMPVFQLATGAMLVLFCLSVLQVRWIGARLMAVIFLFLSGLSGLFFSDFDTLLLVRSIQWAVFTVALAAALILTLANMRQKPAQTLPLVVLLVLLLAEIMFQLLRSSPRPALLRSDGLIDVSLVLFLAWTTLADLRRRSRLSENTTRELVERVEEDWELIMRLKKGQDRLQRKNMDSLRLSSRLMESSQKQALTMGQIMKAIEEATGASQQVVRKEKEILDRTRDVDARIIDFNLQISEALEALEELQEKSRTITKAVGQIIGIAEKTNMLALNTSIEASKAGEAGRGFSALATQTRKLADVTRTVSDQINGLIEESNRAIRQDVDTVKSLGRGFKDIMRQSEDIRTMIEQNALAFEEVSQANLDIKDGVAGVDRTIRTILEVSKDLREMTGRLADAFGWFDDLLRTEQQRAPAAGKENGPPLARPEAEEHMTIYPARIEEYAELEELEAESEEAGEAGGGFPERD